MGSALPAEQTSVKRKDGSVLTASPTIRMFDTCPNWIKLFWSEHIKVETWYVTKLSRQACLLIMRPVSPLSLPYLRSLIRVSGSRVGKVMELPLNVMNIYFLLPFVFIHTSFGFYFIPGGCLWDRSVSGVCKKFWWSVAEMKSAKICWQAVSHTLSIEESFSLIGLAYMSIMFVKLHKHKHILCQLKNLSPWLELQRERW